MPEEIKEVEAKDAELDSVTGGAGEPEVPVTPDLKSERVGEG
jgi:hypothetical protein